MPFCILKNKHKVKRNGLTNPFLFVLKYFKTSIPRLNIEIPIGNNPVFLQKNYNKQNFFNGICI